LLNSPKENSQNIDELIKALGDPLRTKILAVLSNEKICVCDLAKYFGISRNLLSFHLKKLDQVGLLRLERAGNRKYYLLDKKYEKTLKLYLNLLNIN
jgi:DNA-binding transcriptional ArsR family regulator